MDEPKSMLDRAQEFLDAARKNAHDPRGPLLNVAHGNARTAAELAAKSMLLRKAGSYPKSHQIGGRLYREGLVPKDMEPRDVSLFLDQSTRATYGFSVPYTVAEMGLALRIAERLVGAARVWPGGEFHSPPKAATEPGLD